MKWNSRRRNREPTQRSQRQLGHRDDPERSFGGTAQTRSGSRTGCRAEATSQLPRSSGQVSASRRYMTRKPRGESEPQGPATTAGALGYKGAPTLKNGGWGTRKGKSRSLARTPTRAGARAGVPLTRDDNGVGGDAFGDRSPLHRPNASPCERPCKPARAPWRRNRETYTEVAEAVRSQRAQAAAKSPGSLQRFDRRRDSHSEYKGEETNRTLNTEGCGTPIRL